MNKDLLIFKINDDPKIKYQKISIPNNKNNVEELYHMIINKKIIEFDTPVIFINKGHMLNGKEKISDLEKSIICYSFNLINNKNISRIFNPLSSSDLTGSISSLFDNLSNTVFNFNYSNNINNSNSNNNISNNYVLESENNSPITTHIDTDSEIDIPLTDTDSLLSDNESDNNLSNNNVNDINTTDVNTTDVNTTDLNTDINTTNSQPNISTTAFNENIDNFVNSMENALNNFLENNNNADISSISNQFINSLSNFQTNISDSKTKYKEQIEIIKNMGFSNEQLIIQSLIVSDGNVENAVNYYLSN